MSSSTTWGIRDLNGASEGHGRRGEDGGAGVRVRGAAAPPEAGPVARSRARCDLGGGGPRAPWLWGGGQEEGRPEKWSCGAAESRVGRRADYKEQASSFIL